MLLRQWWNPGATLLVLAEIHKMPAWKSWLKDGIDAKLAAQSLTVRQGNHTGASKKV